MGFVRQQANNWRREVPGVRWFKADLHIHTIDDALGRSEELPSCVDASSPSAKQLSAYARQFLDAAISSGVQVLGITPHSPRFAGAVDMSAVWHIVEEWNNGIDLSGTPYREQVFAVFPGFKPRLNDGRGGLDLIFLFDPEIGRERYLQLFDLLMQGRQPWADNQVATAPLSAAGAFDILRDNRRSGGAPSDAAPWDCLALAPHVFRETGLLGTPSEHIEREDFDIGSLVALELPKNSLQDEALQGKPWVNEFVSANRLAFFHSSAAHTLEDIGSRHVWVKMADPTIEALRQAFVAHPTRLRIGHELDNDGSLRALSERPDAMRNERPWLKSVTVDGAASFFAPERAAQPVRFEFNPDLTCVIGGSMTGKSTLLDGLRVHVGAPLPQDARMQRQVGERAAERFLAGAPSIELDIRGSDPTADAHQRWPAEFYTQGELQRLAQDPEAIQHILSRLDASLTDELHNRERVLQARDRDLSNVASRLAEIDDELADAEQSLDRSSRARAELGVFAAVGMEELNRAESSTSTWRETVQATGEILQETDDLISSMNLVRHPVIATAINESTEQIDIDAERLDQVWRSASDAAATLRDGLVEAQRIARTGLRTHETRRDELHVEVERALADQGFDGARINESQALNAQAALLDSYQANLDRIRATADQLRSAFEQGLQERQELVAKQRLAYDSILDLIERRFDGRVAARRLNDGGSRPLEKFVTDLGQRGITRWWNDAKNGAVPSPQVLLARLEDGSLSEIGMSEAVQQTFVSCMTPSRRRDLAVLRCPDRYWLEFRTMDEQYRPLDRLSGGQRVNVLLSLLLATNDHRPLVIDQPEDELDNRFLFETLLPALHRLKGNRQVIVATHSANIVVNGDADHVIQLDAESERGYIACAGAIEEPAVRNAIVQTVDGGDEAFRLRRLKYGF